jgi:hypothetical protein
MNGHQSDTDDMNISPRYATTLAIYRRFADGICDDGYLDFGPDAAEQIYVWESLGKRRYAEVFGSSAISERNGYLHGKRWLDITVKQWQSDIAAGLLDRSELPTEYQVFVRWT